MALLAMTMGDPAGIGPELCLYMLENSDLVPGGELRVIGDREVLERVALEVGLGLPAEELVIDVADARVDAFAIEPGKLDPACGAAAFGYVERAIDGALAGEFDAVVTAPVNKAAIHAAGIEFLGHTEVFAERTGAERACMLQVSDEVTASFVTCHCSLAEVPGLLSRERIAEVIDLSHEALWRLRGGAPKLVGLGLNPHAGEGGMFGREELEVIAPAFDEARARGVDLTGPVAPDTAFLPEVRAATDCFVCMYHDQGHIPLKALACDRAVNVTLGLPIVRTSVDHGTAFDIAWQGKANPGSLVEACRLAVRLLG